MQDRIIISTVLFQIQLRCIIQRHEWIYNYFEIIKRGDYSQDQSLIKFFIIQIKNFNS